MWPSPIENRITVGHTGSTATANAALDVSFIKL